ncbi:MAG: ABC transporter permease, partial [Gammaproteobacteria bacterium]|nr:ABC transporter permease [Gammaproteobacteria bacterium]
MMILILIAQRVAIGLMVLLLVSVLVFAGTEVLPGDVAHAILGQSATPELVAQVRERLGLDEPATLRYFYWLGNLVSGDLGTSLASGASISDLIGERIFNTFLLALSTAVIAIPLAVG